MKTEEFDFEDFEKFCKESIKDYSERLDRAYDIIGRDRCPLSMADKNLYKEIVDALEEYCYENGFDCWELESNIDEWY